MLLTLRSLVWGDYVPPGAWVPINSNQNPAWQGDGPVPSGNWTQIANSATLSWVPVASTQAAGWGAVNTTQTPTWTDVNI